MSDEAEKTPARRRDVGETKEQGGANPKLRRRARFAVVQALYQMELSGEPSNTVMREFLNHRFGYDDEPGMIRVDEPFFENIVAGVVANQDDIDAAISAHLSEKWKLRRLDMTLRALLRASGYEILRRPDIPALVIISEYVGIAGEFFSGKEPGLANAVLDKLAKATRAAEFGLVGGAANPIPKPES